MYHAMGNITHTLTKKRTFSPSNMKSHPLYKKIYEKL